MTSEKAIQLLHRLQDEQFDGIHGDERREALEMAVRALEGDGDIISRQDAIDAQCEVCQIAPKKDRGHNCMYYVKGCKEVECLRNLPSTNNTTTWLGSYCPYTCQYCGKHTDSKTPYCAWCGRRATNYD